MFNFLFHKFSIVPLPSPIPIFCFMFYIRWSDGMRCYRSDWPAFFVLLLSTQVCCQPTVYSGFFVSWIIPFYSPPPPGLMLGAMTASFATGRWANDGKCSTKWVGGTHTRSHIHIHTHTHTHRERERERHTLTHIQTQMRWAVMTVPSGPGGNDSKYGGNDSVKSGCQTGRSLGRNRA